jgi:hypothetical protein
LLLKSLRLRIKIKTRKGGVAQLAERRLCKP